MAGRTAIIGSGITALSAAFQLSKHPECKEIVIYEKNKYIGGHTNTVDITYEVFSFYANNFFLGRKDQC